MTVPPGAAPLAASDAVRAEVTIAVPWILGALPLGTRRTVGSISRRPPYVSMADFAVVAMSPASKTEVESPEIWLVQLHRAAPGEAKRSPRYVFTPLPPFAEPG